MQCKRLQVVFDDITRAELDSTRLHYDVCLGVRDDAEIRHSILYLFAFLSHTADMTKLGE